MDFWFDLGFGLDFYLVFGKKVVGYGLCLASGRSLRPNVADRLIGVVEYGICSTEV